MITGSKPGHIDWAVSGKGFEFALVRTRVNAGFVHDWSIPRPDSLPERSRELGRFLVACQFRQPLKGPFEVFSCSRGWRENLTN
jgi:hypothetical protein